MKSSDSASQTPRLDPDLDEIGSPYPEVEDEEDPDIQLTSRGSFSQSAVKAEPTNFVDSFDAHSLHPYDSGTSRSDQRVVPRSPGRWTLERDGIEYTIIAEVGGMIRSGFESVGKPRSFFRRGRCFVVLSPQLAGSPEVDRTIYLKLRPYIVIRPKASHCLCVPIYTYQGLATTKQGISVEEHAAIVPLGETVQLYAGEKLANEPLYIRVEDPSITIDPMSRINFGSISTIQHNLRVRNMGRLVAESVKRLEGYFAASLHLERPESRD